MFYIINQRNQIIAADNALLSLLKIEHIDELTKQIILGDIQFISTSEENIEFITNDAAFIYATQTSVLSSLLGDLRLVQLTHKKEDAVEVSDLLIDDNNETSASISKNDPATIEDIDDLILVKDELVQVTEESQSITSVANVELEELSLLDDTNLPTETEIPRVDNINDSELFDLTIPNTPEISIDEISLEYNTDKEEAITFETPQKESLEEDTTPIIIYIDEVSENIGISNEDYNTFLNEYIDTSISLETDLNSNNTQIRTTAITTLMQLADVLELPIVNNIISKLITSKPQETEKIVNSFYTTLSRITTKKKPIVSSDLEIHDTTLHTPEDNQTNLSSDIKVANNDENTKSLSLAGIQPIYFDFQLEEAANDLSLPVELIEEFVHDFIEQAHIETEKMLKAYEKGDLDTIQKVGHMLKGASSNLRINALSDTLYNIQFCEDITQLEGFIKNYWGHFLSFEQQIDVLSNKGNN